MSFFLILVDRKCFSQFENNKKLAEFTKTDSKTKFDKKNYFFKEGKKESVKSFCTNSVEFVIY